MACTALVHAPLEGTSRFENDMKLVHAEDLALASLTASDLLLVALAGRYSTAWYPPPASRSVGSRAESCGMARETPAATDIGAARDLAELAPRRGTPAGAPLHTAFHAAAAQRGPTQAAGTVTTVHDQESTATTGLGAPVAMLALTCETEVAGAR